MMNKTKWTLTMLAASMLIMISALAAQAATRTFVSATGTDVGTCLRTAPCAHFGYALTQTDVGGTIVALDTAAYAGVVINKSVTIEAAPGQYGLIKVQPGTAGITINSPASIVVLRNIQIEGFGAASTTGVLQTSGSLIMQRCILTQLSTGVRVTTGSAELDDNTITNNTVAVRAEGQGPDQAVGTGLDPPRVTVVRISGGIIADNATAFEMFNAGANAGGNPGTNDTRGGQCNAMNIFVRSESSVHHINIVGNPILVTVTGNSELNTGCGSSGFLGTYQSQSQNQTNAANQ